MFVYNWQAVCKDTWVVFSFWICMCLKTWTQFIMSGFSSLESQRFCTNFKNNQWNILLLAYELVRISKYRLFWLEWFIFIYYSSLFFFLHWLWILILLLNWWNFKYIRVRNMFFFIMKNVGKFWLVKLNPKICCKMLFIYV